MQELLLQLIQEYQAKVSEAALMLRTSLKLENPMYWRQGKIDQHGFLDLESRVAYYFHGSGCRVSLPSGDVDWDFGHDGRLDGLDPWFLWVFAMEGTNNFPEFKERELLDKAFEEAFLSGVIHQPFKALQDDLFYLRVANAG